MNKELVWLLTLLFLPTEMCAEAQEPNKVYQIGCLATGTPSSAASIREAFLSGLRELGYVKIWLLSIVMLREEVSGFLS